ncbi:MAG: EF-hand domain-containing protein [Opitutae bacterium]
MKKFLTLLTAGILAFGLNAKPEREGGKKGGPPEGRPSREEVMKKFDKDGDGKLSEEEKAELRKAIAQRGGRPGGRRPPPELMKKFDKDGDGKLSESERAELRKTMEERRKEFLAKFDKDGDGKLNEEERKAAMAARPKPGEGKPAGKPDGSGGKKGKGKKEGGKKKKKGGSGAAEVPAEE